MYEGRNQVNANIEIAPTSPHLHASTSFSSMKHALYTKAEADEDWSLLNKVTL